MYSCLDKFITHSYGSKVDVNLFSGENGEIDMRILHLLTNLSRFAQ